MRCAVCRCFRGACRSPCRISSMNGIAACSLGCGRSVFFRGLGKALAIASRTIRRCTFTFLATPAIVPTPNSYSRRISSNSSTLALHSNGLPLPGNARIRVSVRCQGGPNQTAEMGQFTVPKSLAWQSAGEAGAKDFRDLLGGETPEPQLTTALEEAVDGKVALEDEIATVLDLADGVEAPQVHRGPLPPGELRTQHQGPVFEALPNHFRGEAVSGRLQGFGINHGQEGIVVFAEGDALPVQFVFDEAVTVQAVGGVKREEAGDPHDHRSKHRIG